MKNQGTESLLGSFIIVQIEQKCERLHYSPKKVFDTFRGFKSIFSKPENTF